MCASPITIKNPKINSPHFLPGVDPVTITVPCGHCEDCKAAKRQAIYTRLYYEYKECELVNGYCINITLTYAPQSLPHVSFDGVDYPCFCAKDIQNYIKRIRKHFADKGIDCPFTYFCSMELGGTTHRPHYHVLFFVKASNVCWTYFKLIANLKWTFGFRAHGRLGARVVSPKALNYAAKYVAKDAFEDDWYLPLITQLKECYKGDKDTFNFYKRALSGRFLCSRGLGLYCLSFNDANRLHRQECLLPTDKGFKSSPLPLYLDRKLHYQVYYRDKQTGYLYTERKSSDDVPTYVLNTSGFYYIKNRWQTKHTYLVNRLKEFINTNYSNPIIENACYSILGGSVSDIRVFVKSFNLERLAAYQMLYLHRRDYGLIANEDVYVTLDDMLSDYVTLSSSSYRFYVGEEFEGDVLRNIQRPYSIDANVLAYRLNASSVRKEFLGVDCDLFTFISYYLSQCHKVEHAKKVEVSKAYTYRKSLALSLS